MYRQLDTISHAIEAGNLQPAIDWAQGNRAFLSRRSSTFEFALHRSQFIRIATGQNMLGMPGVTVTGNGGNTMALDPDGENLPSSSGSVTPSSLGPVEQAIRYGREHFRLHTAEHLPEIQALFSFALFPPYLFHADPDADAGEHNGGLMLSIEIADPLYTRPVRTASHAEYLNRLYDLVPPAYHHFLDDDQLHAPYLVPLFRLEFCSRNNLAREAPLKTAVEVGTGGALTKIMKGQSACPYCFETCSQQRVDTDFGRLVMPG